MEVLRVIGNDFDGLSQAQLVSMRTYYTGLQEAAQAALEQLSMYEQDTAVERIVGTVMSLEGASNG
jgi:chaperonin cofactor prefoldin